MGITRKIKMGLALGSGAAGGWPHIGVINTLKKVGTEIGTVAGCPIGPLVSATYACDRLPALEDWVTSLSYWDILRLMGLSWQRGGLLCSGRVFNQYRKIVPGIEIENRSRCFAAVITNLSTGCELWLTEGDLYLVIRASRSISGLMTPVVRNGYWLADGAVASPIPISLTCALGADTAIAVDLQYGARLMQQDLFSFNVNEENNENGDSLPWRACLKERLGSITTCRAVTAPMATETMAISIQVLENRLKRNRMVGDLPDTLIQPVCP